MIRLTENGAAGLPPIELDAKSDAISMEEKQRLVLAILRGNGGSIEDQAELARQYDHLVRMAQDAKTDLATINLMLQGKVHARVDATGELYVGLVKESA